MDLKQIGKIKRIYEGVLELDKEIIELEKTAQELSNDDCDITIVLNVENITKKQKSEAKQNILDEDGSLSTGPAHNWFESYHKSIFNRLTVAFDDGTNAAKVESHDGHYKIKDTVGLQVLAVLLSDLLGKRERLLKKLNRYGVTTK